MGLVSQTIRNVVLRSAVALALGTLACVSPTPQSADPPAAVTGPVAVAPQLDLGRAVAELVEAHNRVRAAHHRTPLSVSGPLEAAAREHARDMARRRWMSHRGSDLS